MPLSHLRFRCSNCDSRRADFQLRALWRFHAHREGGFPVLPPMCSLVAVGLMVLCLAGCSSHGPVGQLQPTNCGTPHEFRRCASHAQPVSAPVTPPALPATPAY